MTEVLIFSLLDLMTITSHDTYIKLVVSSIDSSREGSARLILSKGLTASSEVQFDVDQSFEFTLTSDLTVNVLHEF